MWKTLSVIAAILTAGASFLSFLNKGDAEQERDLLATSINNLGDINGRHKEVTNQQEVFVRRKAKMEERRDDALVQQESKKGDLEDKTVEVVDTNGRIKELETSIAKAKSEIAEFGNIEQLKALVDQLQTDLFTAKNGIATLEKNLSSTKARETQTADSIRDYKDLEYRQRNGQMVSIDANIAGVYNNWGFVELDAGAGDGVVSRTKLDVKRGGEKIAELIVTNLENRRSVCDIVPGSMEPGQMLRPGDRVSVSAESLPKPKAERDPNMPADPGGAGPLPDAIPMEDPGVPAGGDDPFSSFGDDPSAPEAEAPAPSDDPFGDL
jgi:hypothetical protein